MKEYAYIHESGKLPRLLQDVPFLKSFTDRHRDEILFSSCFVECNPGEIVMKEGEVDSRIFILLKGKVEVRKGDEVVAQIEKSGEVFGELAVLGSEKRSASVLAKTKLLCLAIDQKFLNEIESPRQDAAYYAAFYGFLCKVLAQRLIRVTEELAAAEKELERLRPR